MSGPASPTKSISPYPNINFVAPDSLHHTNTDTVPSVPSDSSSVSSLSETEPSTYPTRPNFRRSRLERPSLGDRQRSSSIIVPKGMETLQKEKREYPPHDARAMSPRRSSHDLERLEQSARKSLKDQARTLQSSLAALAERIDEVKMGHDKLESENKFLQDYIGGLTRSMSGSGLARTGSTAKRGKK